ncbi:MAG: alkaline phosphatase PhoX [Pseudomonadales bacterium]
MKRRQFVYTSVLFTAGCAASVSDRAAVQALQADPDGILDLPPGFQYSIISRAGDTMSDGLLTPARPDGMAAFAAPDGQIALVRNHENLAGQHALGAFGANLERLPSVDKRFFYDYGDGEMPGMGGTTTLLYDPKSGKVSKSYLSLAGTELNCAGGPTPWGTWLSCEECFDPATLKRTRHIPREKQHGYVFEVDPLAGEIQEPLPLPALGRFIHEAAAIDAKTGTVYLTEDWRDGLLYRCVPNEPGKLSQGGQLQALAFVDEQLTDTANYSADQRIAVGEWNAVRWINVDGADTEDNDLRLRGQAKGAARFVRGEGIWYQDGLIAFTCTEGGADRNGQIFLYRSTDDNLGELKLLVEAAADSPMHNADNLSFTPWGDLIVCEDRSENCGLYLLKLDGSYTQFAYHRASRSELAGVCFAPDGKTLFVNIQDIGLTLAITGPF